MAEAKSMTGEVKKIAADAQAAGADFTSAVASDVRQFAKDVGKSGGKAGAALQDDLNDLQKDVSRILITLGKLAQQISGDVADAAHETFDELAIDTRKAGKTLKKSARSAANGTEAAITQNPFTSIMIAVGAGYLISLMMRR